MSLAKESETWVGPQLPTSPTLRRRPLWPTSRTTTTNSPLSAIASGAPGPANDWRSRSSPTTRIRRSTAGWPRSPTTKSPVRTPSASPRLACTPASRRSSTSPRTESRSGDPGRRRFHSAPAGPSHSLFPIYRDFIFLKIHPKFQAIFSET